MTTWGDILRGSSGAMPAMRPTPMPTMQWPAQFGQPQQPNLFFSQFPSMSVPTFPMQPPAPTYSPPQSPAFGATQPTPMPQLNAPQWSAPQSNAQPGPSFFSQFPPMTTPQMPPSQGLLEMPQALPAPAPWPTQGMLAAPQPEPPPPTPAVFQWPAYQPPPGVTFNPQPAVPDRSFAGTALGALLDRMGPMTTEFGMQQPNSFVNFFEQS